MVVCVNELLELMFNLGESFVDLFVDCLVFEDFDVDVVGVCGYGFVCLNQFAFEYLFGVC